MNEAVKTTDLFGNEITIKFGDPAAAKKLRDKARGSAAPIGSGPQGETCKTCAHSYNHEYAKRYWKCDLVKATASPRTDIRLKWAACARWEKKPEPEPEPKTPDHEIETPVTDHDLSNDQGCPPLRMDERAAPAGIPAGQPLPVLASCGDGQEEDCVREPDGSVRGVDIGGSGVVRGQDADETLSYPNAPGFKGTASSKEASPGKYAASRLRSAVLAHLRAHGPATPDECASALSESILSIRPRFSELRLQGKIMPTGEHRKNASGKKAEVLAIIQ